MSTPKAKTVLVINPQSQNGELGRRWPQLSGVIRRELAFEEVRTRRPGDATRLTREALADGAERVVAIGGDGTINEVINGFFDQGEPVAPDAALGVLPYGTGGDFRKTIHIPKSLTTGARILARGKTKKIDVGRLDLTTRSGGAETRVYANIASFGVSGMVDRFVNEASKRLGGRLSFAFATVKASIVYRNQRVRMVFDDDEASAETATVYTVAVANGRYFGGGMYIAPDAEIDDGFFDVVTLGDINLLDFVRNGRHIYGGTHLGLDKVSCRRARKLRAEPAGGDVVEIDMDGETPGILPATFTLMPQALSLVVP